MYESIVIGSDLSSFIAALLSARYGRRTLLLSECGLDDCVKASGYTFNIDPFPWSGFGTGQIFTKLLSELNIPLPEPARISPLNPAFQVILPEHRIDFFIEREALIDDIRREHPDEGGKIQTLYQSVARVGDIFDKTLRETLESNDRSLKEILKNWFDMPSFIGGIWRLSQMLRSVEKLPSLGTMFDSELTLFSNQVVNHSKPFSSAYLLSLPWRGLYYHFGGKHLMMGLLRKRFEELQGETLTNCAITAIRTGEKIEVDIKPKGKPIHAVGQELVISTKSPALAALLSEDRKLSKLARKLGRIETVGHPFTLHMGVDNRGLPHCMSEYVIFVPERNGNAAQDMGPFLFLETSVADDAGVAPRGKRTLTATAFLTRSPLHIKNGELHAAAEEMIGALARFLPFLRERIDFMDVERSIDVSRRYQQVVNPRYRFPGMFVPGLMTLPLRSPLRNIILTGGITFAGLGFEGEVLSGMKAGYFTSKDARR